MFPGVGSKTIGAATLAVVLAAAPTSLFGLCQERTLDFRFSPAAGKSRNWCWAAIGQTVMEVLGEDPARACQCRQAEEVLGVAGCCSSATSCTPAETLPGRCDQPRWPPFVEKPEVYTFDYRTTCDELPGRQNDDGCEARPLEWPALVRELCSGWPVIASLRPRGSSVGHTVVVKGFSTHPSPRVLVVDPMRVCPSGRQCAGELDEGLWLSYEEYAAGWGGMVHWVDFFGIRRKQ